MLAAKPLEGQNPLWLDVWTMDRDLSDEDITVDAPPSLRLGTTHLSAGVADLSFEAESPLVPPVELLERLPSYDCLFQGGGQQIFFPPLEAPRRPQEQTCWSSFLEHSRVPVVTEEVAREALLSFVSSKCCYGRSAARDLVIQQMKQQMLCRYRLETFSESRISEWTFQPFTNHVVDGPRRGTSPKLWDIKVQVPPMFQEETRKFQVPHSSLVKLIACLVSTVGLDSGLRFAPCVFLALPLGVLASGKGRLPPLALNGCTSVWDGDMGAGAGVGVEVAKRQVTEKLDPRKVFLPQECHKCHGRGHYKCSGCHGASMVSLVWLMVRCPSCSGAKRRAKQPGRCQLCSGSGRHRCSTCSGRGNKTCATCKGEKKLLHFVQLVIVWKNSLFEFVSEHRLDCPGQLLAKAQGETLFKDENTTVLTLGQSSEMVRLSPQVYPLADFPLREISLASQRGIAQHSAATLASRARVLQQRQTIELIPLTEVHYWYQGKTNVYYIYGTDHRVYVADYPERYCCSCTII
ncbi:hypothetical protein QTO34_006994 [Cnephaeus nilssonii]|uniref:Protein SSUH2 homolog n=1 Tax=Cnephaeus nilssonii TaxID=3371016 RepID=A0AA40HJF8_CNENI|nr:hypothetical protein QTO34_006994 [Eptesicus nilssonii]